MSLPWIELLTAAFGGGASMKLIDYLWSELKERRASRHIVHHGVETHLDPILKTADELFGKLRDHAIRDWADFKRDRGDSDPTFEEQVDLGATLYLFAHFWARVAVLRRDSLYIELGQDRQGQQLKSFIRSLESRRVRVIDRAWQRAIGEALLKNDAKELTRACMSSYEFLNAYVNDAGFRRWLQPLVEMLYRSSHTSERQRLLLYGAVLHMMIDTLDPDHEVTTERPGYGNKLSNRTARQLKQQIVGFYLRFVDNLEKYLPPASPGEPKQR